MDTQIIKDALKKITFPGYTRDIVSFGFVKQIVENNGNVEVLIEFSSDKTEAEKSIRAQAKEAILALGGVQSVNIVINRVASSRVGEEEEKLKQAKKLAMLSNVRQKIAITSGKGGVGKSTITANLACAFAGIYAARLANDYAVGLMDCDIYGPSIPLLMGTDLKADYDGEKILPNSAYGVRVMSIGMFVGQEEPVIWRGPMINSAFKQFCEDVRWGELELMLFDMPPGTGDAQLCISQNLDLDGAVIVTTPQNAATNVAIRGANMFKKLGVPIVGVIENMSYMLDDNGKKLYPFGQGGGQRTAEKLDCPFLGEIPLSQNLMQAGENSRPLVTSDPRSPAGIALYNIANKIITH